MKIEKVIKIVLAVMLILCLAPMPYDYYELVRFSSMLGFAILGYQSFKDKNEIFGIIFFGLVLIFQPFWKIKLGRDIWQIVDLIVAIGLIVSLFHKNIKTES
jgi:hypothetical protein